jgi:hypothetical protein
VGGWVENLGGRKIFRGQGGRQILEIGRSKNFRAQVGRQIF